MARNIVPLEVYDSLDEAAGKLRASDRSKQQHNGTLKLVRQYMALQSFEEVGAQLAKQIAPPARYPKRAKVDKKKERVLNLVVSDTHFASLLDPEETLTHYGPTEEARRMAAVFRQAMEYKSQYRDHTRLRVLLLGDIIQGQLHDARDGAPMGSQVASATSILAQGLRYLATGFSSVEVFCQTGNHGRNKARHLERAVQQKWDSNEYGVYRCLQIALEPLKNVTIHVPKTPWVEFDSWGETCFATHGDTVFDPGYPGRSLNMAKISSQVAKWRAKKNHQKNYQLFVVGHVHIGSVTWLPEGAAFMSNGCLIPPDAYARSIGVVDTVCGQWLFESVDGHVLGDHRFVTVDENTDKDASLDRIIKPFDYVK